MGLVFPRVARNFIKNGYFPTDEQTLEGVLACLATDAEHLRVLDPCCGCGTALDFVRAHLEGHGAKVEALGVEFDIERARHAKTLLCRAIHADINDVHVTPKGVSLLFLNPPYGYALRDQAGTGDQKGSDRLEKMFFRKTVPWLTPGGVLVLIVPYTVLDAEFCNMIARQFTDVEIRMAPERQFRQAVIFGRKKRSEGPSADTAKKLLEAATAGYEGVPTLDPATPPRTYVVPEARDDRFGFVALKLDAEQLAEELQRLRAHTLWPTFQAFSKSALSPNRRPLRPLTDWHLALALAAGQIGGVIRSPSGRAMLIKGDTIKDKVKQVEASTDDQGNTSVTTVLTDRFVPTIKAIDVTPGADSFGTVFTIS